MVVLYRKYRPQKIAEIDNSLVREKLATILSSSRIPHAFLFSGPKGTGKTSSARIIGKSVNCEKNNGRGEPCNRCSTCVSITNGNNLDVLEIDAASNRGIDEIRELRDKIKLAPAGARKKVYIIDEVHMLTNEAFNALLKTLEEPPEHALFILCTTNAEKLPETIIDRCTRIDFKRATSEDLLQSLKRVKKGEGRDIEKDALEEIARRSDGSYRDSHKLLEEVLTTYPRAKITAELVKKVLGEKEAASELFGWVSPADAKKGLEMVGKLVDKGADLKFVCETILNVLHGQLLKKYGLEEKDYVVNEQLNNLTIEQLKSLLALFSQASQELRTATIPQLPLELAIVEWCEQEIKNEKWTRSKIATPAESGIKMKNMVSNASQGNTSDGDPKGLLRGEGIGERQWEEILAAVKPLNHSVAGLLRSCRPASFDGKTLSIEVFYKFHYDKLSEAKVRQLLEKVAEEVFGTEVKITPSFKPKT